MTTPSISTDGVPPTVTMTITRRMGIGMAPAESRNSVSSGERLSMTKRIWNTLGPLSFTVILMLCSASSATRGAGTGTVGPTSSVS